MCYDGIELKVSESPYFINYLLQSSLHLSFSSLTSILSTLFITYTFRNIYNYPSTVTAEDYSVGLSVFIMQFF